MINATYKQLFKLETDLFPKDFSPRSKVGNALIKSGEYVKGLTQKAGVVSAVTTVGLTTAIYENWHGLGEWYVKNYLVPYYHILFPFGTNEPVMNSLITASMVIWPILPAAVYGVGAGIKRLGKTIAPKKGKIE